MCVAERNHFPLLPGKITAYFILVIFLSTFKLVPNRFLNFRKCQKNEIMSFYMINLIMSLRELFCNEFFFFLEFGTSVDPGSHVIHVCCNRVTKAFVKNTLRFVKGQKIQILLWKFHFSHGRCLSLMG